MAASCASAAWNSTQSVAFALAAQGAADRTVIVTDSQARFAYGSWGGRRPSLAGYVTLTETKKGAIRLAEY